MSPELDKLLGDLNTPLLKTRANPTSVVQSQDGTTRILPSKMENTNAPEMLEDYSKRVDALFGAADKIPAYHVIRKEKPEHRLMLWMRLQGHSIKEIAAATGHAYNTVARVNAQPWFLEAFTTLSTHFGADALSKFLEGEVVKSAETLVQLRDTAESESVRAAAANAILDRVRGKPTAKVEVKETGKIEHVVHDIAKLQEEYARNQQILASRGIGAAQSN